MRTITVCLLFFFGMIFSITPTEAQEIRENEKGEKLVVYPDGSWRYYNESQIRPAGTFPVVTDTIGELETLTNLTEEVVRKLYYRKSQLVKEANQVAEKRIKEATRQREHLEVELAQAALKGLDDEVERLKLRLEAARKTESQAQKEADLAQKELFETNELSQKGNLMEAFVQKQKDRAAKIELNSESNSADFFSASFLMPQEFNYLTENEMDFNLFLNPPTPGCNFGFDGIDPNTGRRIKEMKSAPLFAHTDDQLRLYMKEKEYLECNAYLANVDGGFRMLNLDFQFAYPNAREAYGFIEEGSILTILFLNGDFINLKSGVLSNGKYDMDTELLTYQVQYPVSQGQVSYLKKNEVDRIRVYWSSGLEEYEVFELDFFMNQAACLNW